MREERNDGDSIEDIIATAKYGGGIFFSSRDWVNSQNTKNNGSIFVLWIVIKSKATIN